MVNTELPLPDPPTRQRSNHETDDAASITSDRMSAHDLANTSMPTEVLRHLGESRNNSRAELAAAHGQDEDDALDAPTLALKRIALSNAWDPQLATWSQLQSVIRARIQRHFTEFESQEAALFDKALDPPWTLTADQVSSLKDDTIALLQRFDDPDKPPFTLQRLAELAWTPKPYYASLPKYVRAVQRCLLVCSSQSDFPPEEALSTLPSAQLHPSITHPLGGDTTLTMRGRSTSNSSESSDSASLASASLPSTPLLSPIPWLNNKRSPTPDAPDNSMASNGANGSADSSASSQSILSPPLAASHPVASPTGGRIDELDPGQEARDKGEADQDPASLTEHPHALSGLGLALDGGEGGSSSPSGPSSTGGNGGKHALEERFTHASSSPDRGPEPVAEGKAPAAGVPEDAPGPHAYQESEESGTPSGQVEDVEMKDA